MTPCNYIPPNDRVGEVYPTPVPVVRAWGYDLGGNYVEGYADGWNEACDACAPHVTRLQAEAEQLTIGFRQEQIKRRAEIDTLQSELTRAIGLLRMVSDKGLLGYMKYDVDDFLSNQSAPGN